MSVFIENIGGGGAKTNNRPDIPPGSQSRFFGDSFAIGPGINYAFNTYYFMLSAGSAGANVRSGPPINGLQIESIDGIYWLMFTPWPLAWMNALRVTQMSQFGLWNMPADGGILHAMTVCTGSVANLATLADGYSRPSGAYALVAEQTTDNAAGVCDLSIELLRFGESGISPNINPPTRTVLLDCGTVESWSLYEQQNGIRGGTLIRFQASDLTDRWQLSAFVAQDYYPAGPGTPVNWENRGTVEDSFLTTGMPGFGASNFPTGETGLIQGTDFYNAVEHNPWPIDTYTVSSTGLRIEPPDSRRWNSEPVPHTFLRGRLIP